MALPQQIFLRNVDGELLGPLPRKALEVLFDTRIIDGATPVSENGVAFRALREIPELYARVEEVKALLNEGKDPWTGVEDSPTADVAASAAPSSDRPRRAMLRAAIDKSTGHLVFGSAEGELRVVYKDGKIVAVETTIPERSLARYLVDHNVASEAAVAAAKVKAPEMGGDLGGALIAAGAVPPHTYFEKFIDWAKKALASVVTHSFRDADLEAKDVPSPVVPLGFDRFGILIEIVRAAGDRLFYSELLTPKRSCPLIPSFPEDVKLEELKLKAGELRVINSVNGVKTLGEVLDTFGGSDQKSTETLHVVYFAEQTGLIVYGEDPLHAKEHAEAERVREQLDKLRKKNYFEILGVSEKSTDEETRTKYADLAKLHHPDKLRQGAAPDLLEVKKEFFALINETFEALQTEKQRYEYANDVAQGRAGGTEDLEKVQAVLQAETLFKKAEILMKVKKMDDAIAHLDEAISLKPDDVEFKIYRAYYGFLGEKNAANAGELAEKAIKQIQALLKTESNIASGYMFLGYLNKIVGKPQVAVKYFEKVLEFDEKNVEAAREVRIHRMREDKEKGSGTKKKWF